MKIPISLFVSSCVESLVSTHDCTLHSVTQLDVHLSLPCLLLVLTNEHLENSIYPVDVIWLVAGTVVGLRTKVQIVVVECTQIAICVLRHALEPLLFHRLFGARLLLTYHTTPRFGLLLLVCIVQVGLRRISIPVMAGQVTVKLLATLSISPKLPRKRAWSWMAESKISKVFTLREMDGALLVLASVAMPFERLCTDF